MKFDKNWLLLVAIVFGVASTAYAIGQERQQRADCERRGGRPMWDAGLVCFKKDAVLP